MSSAVPSPILDVAIAGAGTVGLALAVALRTELGPALRLAVFDPALGKAPAAETRSSMIAADGRRLLERLGAWPAGAAPVAGLRITDSRLEDALRPTFLQLGEPTREGEPFAHMVADAELRAALKARAEALSIDLVAEAITGHQTGRGRTLLELSSGAQREARLLAAADSARSQVRQRARIPIHAFDYDQIALVATLRHEAPHHGIAVQHFLPGGPFAMLPLRGDRSSLVWSERVSVAEAMAAADDSRFLAEVEKRAGPDYGALSLEGERGSFRLRFLLARSFVAPRVALVGDAAHVVHPLAGQGLNAGLRDVAALASILAASARKGEDVGSESVLGLYERARRFDVAALAATTDGLYRLFASSAARGIRDIGMGLVDRAPAVKAMIASAASGA
jgi:2-octaprenyl-6-methoxyphenol hydroxylase